MTIEQNNDDQIIFADDLLPSPLAPDVFPPWIVLVVDDDPEIHTMTGFILSDLSFHCRPLKMLHALSAREAEEIIADTPSLALILLDVVMETDDAGLQLVKKIRGDLNNQLVRIILRTGQPGHAPERLVLLEYDINDYKAKTELTAERMFTTVITALRAFETITALVDERKAVEYANHRAEEHRAATIALEKRKADERKAELDAIATHLNMTVLPRLEQTTAMALSLQGVGSEITTCLNDMSKELKELLVVLNDD